MKMLAFLFTLGFASHQELSALGGRNLLTGENISFPLQKTSLGSVVLFLSMKCPGSRSHLQEIDRLHQDFPQFQFIGVHSNADEPTKEAREDFKEAHLNFPILQDEAHRLADEFKANRTPQVFVLNTLGEVVYRGGISSSFRAENAKSHPLRDALEDLSHSRAVRVSESRTLGCLIEREEKISHVW